MGRKYQDAKLHNLTVVEYLGKGKVKCICDCGNTTEGYLSNILNGKKKSCRCLYKESRDTCNKKHGMYGTTLYKKWSGMKRRCYNPNEERYPNYGGRGIKVCDKWKDSFENFYNDMNTTFFDGASLERVDVDGDYSPENCKWITLAEQARNKTITKYYLYEGEERPLSEISEMCGIDIKLIHQRIYRDGKTVEEATK